MPTRCPTLPDSSTQLDCPNAGTPNPCSTEKAEDAAPVASGRGDGPLILARKAALNEHGISVQRCWLGTVSITPLLAQSSTYLSHNCGFLSLLLPCGCTARRARLPEVPYEIHQHPCENFHSYGVSWPQGRRVPCVCAAPLSRVCAAWSCRSLDSRCQNAYGPREK